MANEEKKIRLRLNTPSDIRRTLARITNMIANNEIDTKKANTIIYSCNSILNSIRVDELEKQVQDLEDLINDNKK
ncbi:hypothetical protein [uncultured Clostridium sp.]|uniref:hypothetical protein n=1 Tax=uncultured Clostridium sp. TaxID=59620 RepID=UPI00280C1724|nr:hypothetical protein [uncultured Clostridium sp.]